MKRNIIILVSLLIITAAFVWVAMPNELSQSSTNDQYLATITYKRYGSIGLLNQYDSAKYKLVRVRNGVMVWEKTLNDGEIIDFYELTDRQVHLIRWENKDRVIFTDINSIEIVCDLVSIDEI